MKVPDLLTNEKKMKRLKISLNMVALLNYAYALVIIVMSFIRLRFSVDVIDTLTIGIVLSIYAYLIEASYHIYNKGKERTPSES